MKSRSFQILLLASPKLNSKERWKQEGRTRQLNCPNWTQLINTIVASLVGHNFQTWYIASWSCWEIMWMNSHSFTSIFLFLSLSLFSHYNCSHNNSFKTTTSRDLLDDQYRIFFLVAVSSKQISCFYSPLKLIFTFQCWNESHKSIVGGLIYPRRQFAAKCRDWRITGSNENPVLWLSAC